MGNDLVNSGVLSSFNLIKELFLITGQKIGHRKNPNEEADFYAISLHGKGGVECKIMNGSRNARRGRKAAADGNNCYSLLFLFR